MEEGWVCLGVGKHQHPWTEVTEEQSSSQDEEHSHSKEAVSSTPREKDVSKVCKFPSTYGLCFYDPAILLLPTSVGLCFNQGTDTVSLIHEALRGKLMTNMEYSALHILR